MLRHGKNTPHHSFQSQQNFYIYPQVSLFYHLKKLHIKGKLEANIQKGGHASGATDALDGIYPHRARPCPTHRGQEQHGGPTLVGLQSCRTQTVTTHNCISAPEMTTLRKREACEGDRECHLGMRMITGTCVTRWHVNRDLLAHSQVGLWISRI